jgi:hypothetical protein
MLLGFDTPAYKFDSDRVKTLSFEEERSMKRTQGILMILVFTASLSVTAQTTPSIPVTVDCAAGQSLNRTLAKLDKNVAPDLCTDSELVRND